MSEAAQKLFGVDANGQALPKGPAPAQGNANAASQPQAPSQSKASGGSQEAPPLSNRPSPKKPSMTPPPRRMTLSGGKDRPEKKDQ